MNYTVSTLINRSRSEVFRFVTRFENQPRWQAASLENTQTSPGPMGLGATYRHVGKWLGRRFETTGEVTEFELDSKWAYRSSSGPFQLEMRYRFEPAPHGTRMTLDAESADAGWFKVAGPMLNGMAKRLLQSDLAQLKKVLEEGE